MMQRAIQSLPATFKTIAASALVFLAACANLGPDFQEADPGWLAEWQPSLYGQLTADIDAQSAPLEQWWTRFDDPALETLIAKVLEQNPSLQIAGLRVLESYARLGGARALRLPQVQELNASAAYLRQRQQDGLLPASENSFGSYSAAFNLGWELDFWGRFNRGIQAADAAFLSSVANQRDMQVLLTAQTASLYFAYRTTRLRIAIARRNAEIQQRSFEITQQLFDSGQQSELDLQQARTQYLATLATIPDLERSLTQLRNGIALLLGKPPQTVAAIETGVQELPEMEPTAISGIPATLLLRRPDVRASAWQAAAQSSQIGVAKADLYPAISLFGSFGWTGDSLGVTGDGSSFAVGPSLRWNLFDYGRIRANVRVQDVRLQQALLAFDLTLLQAAREVDDAAIAVVKTAEARQVLGQSRAAAERALEIANRRYREGYADFQRVLDAQRALFSQEESELVNDGAHIAAVVELYKSLGGGWQAESFESMIPDTIRAELRERNGWGELLDAAIPTALDSASSKERSP